METPQEAQLRKARARIEADHQAAMRHLARSYRRQTRSCSKPSITLTKGYGPLCSTRATPSLPSWSAASQLWASKSVTWT